MLADRLPILRSFRAPELLDAETVAALSKDARETTKKLQTVIEERVSSLDTFTGSGLNTYLEMQSGKLTGIAAVAAIESSVASRHLARWTAILASSTTILAVGTVVLAVVTALK